MNFLELCRAARQEAGLSGSGPSSVVSAVGDEKRVVDSTRTAYSDIQAMQGGLWNWLWRPLEPVALEAGRSVYDPVDEFSVLPLRWSSLSIDGRELQIVSWAEMRRLTQSSISGVPFCAAVRPDRSLVFYPTPTDAHELTGEYYVSSEKMTENAHIPLMPEQYHMAIVWRAVELLAQFEEAPALIQSARDNFNRLYAMMLINELPGVDTAGPLA